MSILLVGAGPEAFDAAPVLALVAASEVEGRYGQPWELDDRLAA